MRALRMISVAGARTLTEETGHHSLATVGIQRPRVARGFSQLPTDGLV
jgi:hypothetical protein